MTLAESTVWLAIAALWLSLELARERKRNDGEHDNGRSAAGRLGKRVGRDYVITPADVARYQAKRRKPGRPKKRR